MESGIAVAAAPPALDIDALQFLRGTRKVIDLPSLSLAAGEHCAVLGPSGCGKSTLLHLVAGLLTPAHGTIRVAGQDLHAMSNAARDRFRGRHMGIVFQRLHLLPSLTLLQNLQIAGRLSGTKEDRERLDTLLSTLGIRDRMHARPSGLSQGEMQRAAIARAVIQRPTLVLADEPTSSLDDGNAARVMDLLLAQTAACGAALLVVTHDARVRDRFPRHLTLEVRT